MDYSVLNTMTDLTRQRISSNLSIPLKPNTYSKSSLPPKNISDTKNSALHKASLEFEAIFIKQMLNAMKNHYEVRINGWGYCSKYF